MADVTKYVVDAAVPGGPFVKSVVQGLFEGLLHGGGGHGYNPSAPAPIIQASRGAVPDQPVARPGPSSTKATSPLVVDAASADEPTHDVGAVIASGVAQVVLGGMGIPTNIARQIQARIDAQEVYRQPVVVKPTPAPQIPTPGASQAKAPGVGKADGNANVSVAITPTPGMGAILDTSHPWSSTPPISEEPMDVGSLLGQVATSYIQARYAPTQQVIQATPAGLPIPGTNYTIEGDIPFIDIGTQTKRRRRRRQLLTRSDYSALSEISALLQSLSPSQAKLMLPIIEKAVRR